MIGRTLRRGKKERGGSWQYRTTLLPGKHKLPIHCIVLSYSYLTSLLPKDILISIGTPARIYSPIGRFFPTRRGYSTKGQTGLYEFHFLIPSYFYAITLSSFSMLNFHFIMDALICLRFTIYYDLLRTMSRRMSNEIIFLSSFFFFSYLGRSDLFVRRNILRVESYRSRCHRV